MMLRACEFQRFSMTRLWQCFSFFIVGRDLVRGFHRRVRVSLAECLLVSERGKNWKISERGRAQREPPWRQKFKLPPLRAERRRHLALVWENYGTRPTRHSRHPGDVPVGLDPQLSMSKKKQRPQSRGQHRRQNCGAAGRPYGSLTFRQ